MRIDYYAKLRDAVGRGTEEVSPPAEVRTLGGLIAWLASREGGTMLGGAGDVYGAIDDVVAAHDATIGDAKTISLFPAMTGG